jgi:hypothetical protein
MGRSRQRPGVRIATRPAPPSNNPGMSTKRHLETAVDELERKLRRLRNDVEDGTPRGEEIGSEIRQIMRRQLEPVKDLVRRVEN